MKFARMLKDHGIQVIRFENVAVIANPRIILESDPFLGVGPLSLTEFRT